MGPRPSTCYASLPDGNNKLILKLGKWVDIHKVFIYPQPQGWEQKKNFEELQVYVSGKYCGQFVKLNEPRDKHNPHWVFCKPGTKGNKVVLKWGTNNIPKNNRMIVCGVFLLAGPKTPRDSSETRRIDFQSKMP